MSHSHDHAAGASGPRLVLSIALTVAFVIAEAVAGYFSHSLALMSDAGHNLSDALALILSWYGLRAARRPSTSERTYGSHRVGILAALANALTLVAIGAVLMWEAVGRFRDPQPVHGGPMIGVALVAVVLNGMISLWLRGAAEGDLNIRSAYLHMLGDAVSALGVVLAGVVVAATGSPVADPVVSLLIGAAILCSSWGIITEAVNVLLAASPEGVDMRALERSIKGVHGVLGVHDLHVWTVASGIHIATFHVLVSEQSVRDGEQVLKAVAGVLRHDFGIGHTTIQVEVEGCGADELYCTLRPLTRGHEGHEH
jgi:cobalt-zinc-cadmium efflux system protein